MNSRVQAQFLIGVGALVLLVLHLAPEPATLADDGQLHPYNPQLNFLSEYVRTQYGHGMTAWFVIMGAATLATARTFLAQELRREAAAIAAVGIVLVLLACFPTDLAELRTDTSTCGDPTRIEPCTWVGRVHDALPTLIFALGALTLGSLGKRAKSEARALLRTGALLGALALVLLVASHFWLRSWFDGRYWVGLPQRVVVLAGAAWLWLANRSLGPALGAPG